MTIETKAQTSFKETAYTYIKNQIINGQLAPGDIIDEKKYIAELNISRTPIREALNSLAEEDLVIIMSRRGIVVSHVLIKDILDIYETRKMLEPGIITMIAGRTDSAQLEQFKEEFSKTDMISSTSTGRDLDSEFHLYLAECTKNKFLIKTEELLMNQSQRIRVLSSSSDKNRDIEARKEHIQIIEYLLAGNSNAAQQICREHLEKSIKRYQKIFSNSSMFSLQ